MAKAKKRTKRDKWHDDELIALWRIKQAHELVRDAQSDLDDELVELTFRRSEDAIMKIVNDSLSFDQFCERERVMYYKPQTGDDKHQICVTRL